MVKLCSAEKVCIIYFYFGFYYYLPELFTIIEEAHNLGETKAIEGNAQADYSFHIWSKWHLN